MDAKRLKFAQEKQSEDVIDIGVGECDAGDGRVASRLAGMQFRRGFDLKAQVGRSAEQKPKDGVLGERELRLSARLAVEDAASHGTAVMASAIPLRKCATGGGT